MKITAVRVFRVEGALRDGMALFETPRLGLAPFERTPYRAAFTEIETDTGITGLSYGGSRMTAAVGQELIGEDPLAVEYLWHRMHTGTYMRQERMSAISVLDLALWDLIGKARGEPVYRLLGGPVQPRVHAYAGMLGYSTEPERAAQVSAETVAQGFTALKWYLSYNASHGDEGLNRNVALIRAVREAVGEDVDIMVDWLLSEPTENSLLYAIKLARRLEPYHPAWIEEPLPFDAQEAHVRLSRATSIPLAYGEHFQGRWQIKQLLDLGAASVLQPDPINAGGITEMRKIISLASIYGVPVIPHGNESGRMAIHLQMATPAYMAPLCEWGVKLNANAQHFYTDFYAPQNGYFAPPEGDGFGFALDEAKIKQRTEVTP